MNVIPLEVFNIRPLRKFIRLIFVFVRILPSEFVALHLPEMHDETRKQITICNDEYNLLPIHTVFTGICS